MNNQNQGTFNELENSFQSYDSDYENSNPDATTVTSYENILKENEANGVEIPKLVGNYAENNISHQLQQLEGQPESSLVSNDNYCYYNDPQES